MTRQLLIFLIVTPLFMVGCTSNSEQITFRNDQQTQIVYAHGGQTGRFTLFVSEELADGLESGDISLPEGVTLTRALYEDPEFESRHRAAGLHRWYYAEVDESVPLTKAGETLSGLDGLLYMEETPTPAPDAFIPFNDPNSSLQWHLNNLGTIVNGAKAGCDINVLPVWERFTGGKPEVIVAVVDTGVQPDHPDLNGVVIPAGSDGSKSFLSSKFLTPYNITPQRHGTHVAGIIAAINNNGTGGCGIAGGTTGGGGVRILDCQAIASEEFDNGNTYSALVWAADHGAVLANNSWNFTYENESKVPASTPGDIVSAINYFIEYAGTDKHGNQTGPMKGGVVFFSAGNKSWSRSQPSMYEGVIAVGATGPAGESSTYTNYGDWVDICAPGGNYNPYGSYNAIIYSTVSGGGYAQMQGTSQAAPMACGVAALLVSQFGGPGFTNTDLKRMLLGGADREYSHQVPIGPALDAFSSFVYDGRQMDPVTSIEISTAASSASLRWTVGNCQDGLFYAYKVLLAEKESSLRAADPFAIPSDVRCLTVRATAPGTVLSAVLDGLVPSKDYYATIIGYTRSHQYPSGNSIVGFRLNGAPVISRNDSGPVELHHNERRQLILSCSDPDGDALSVTVDPGSPACSWTYSGGILTLSFDATAAAPGYYFAKITVDDGKTSTGLELKYTILENQPVALLKLVPDIIMDASGSYALMLDEYFADPDGDAVFYEVECSEPAVSLAIGGGAAGGSAVGSVLSVSCAGFCVTTLTIRASDGSTPSRVVQLHLRVQDHPSGICISSPVVSDKLLVSCSQAGDVEVVIYSSTGRKVYSGKVHQSPFDPGAVTVSGLSPGRYTVRLKFGSSERKLNIVKI